MRIRVLEDAKREDIWTATPEKKTREDALVDRYGEFVDKTVAARILGVTRATVYKMIADGRIEAACGGERVDVRSIARYQYSRTPPEYPRGEWDGMTVSLIRYTPEPDELCGLAARLCTGSTGDPLKALRGCA